MRTRKQFAASVPIEPYFRRQMRDPEFRRAYEDPAHEFSIIRQIIDLRLKRKMTQAQLAKRIGKLQPSIARLESRGQVKNLDYLERIANALGARVEVRLVPRKARGSKQGRRQIA